jgi:peroxiredoxin
MSEVLARQLEAADRRWLEAWLRGPQRIRWERPPPQAGDLAPDVELINVEGKPTRLSGFWSGGPAHLIFLRHYGCSCGKERAAQLREEYPRLVGAGAQVIAIGQGEPERTIEYIKVRQMPCPVLCDPQYQAYEAYALLEGTPPQILHDFRWVPGDEATGRKLMDSRRHGDLRLVDNPWLLPAEFIIDGQGIIRLAHRYQYCEDFPPLTVLLGAILAASG